MCMASGKGKKRQRVLAASGQVTWKPRNVGVQDEKVHSPPQVLRRYTAATCAVAVAKPDDPFLESIHKISTRPKAKFYCSLMATDQHSVNVLLSKWVVMRQSEVGSNNLFHAASFCTQHKTGAVVEVVTEFLGLLSQSFCLAACVSNGEFMDDVLANARKHLEK